jgi:hypothetical protein
MAFWGFLVVFWNFPVTGIFRISRFLPIQDGFPDICPFSHAGVVTSRGERTGRFLYDKTSDMQWGQTIDLSLLG